MGNKPFSALSLLAVLGLGMLACATHRYGVDNYARSLRLAAVLERPRARMGDTIVVKHLLTNASDHPIEACVSDAKGYTFFRIGGEALGHMQVVDHSPCVRRFRLEPAEVFEW